MCGRLDTSHLGWRYIHQALSGFLPPTHVPLNLEGSAGVRPTTSQLTARLDGDGVLKKMRWALVPSGATASR